MRPRVAQPSGRTTMPDEPVIDASRTGETDRAAIAEAARRVHAEAKTDALHEPSVRFWYTRRALTGAILALLAAVITLAIRTWPIAEPQGHGTLGTFWGIGVTLVGVLYLIGFFLADRYQSAARAILLIGGLVHLSLALTSGMIVDAQNAAPAWQAMLFDVVPAVLALVALFLISPRATRREAASEDVSERMRARL